MKILLCGGGTLGSVNPLIAVCEEAQKFGKVWQWFWIGTKTGPERALARAVGIDYHYLGTTKLRRYLSLANFFIPFVLLAAFIKSFILLVRIRPQALITAGSFVGVPVVWAAWALRHLSFWSPARSFGRGDRISIIVHQQDICPGLANKLCAPFADKITVSFEKSLADYPRGKAEWTGNPVREQINKGSREEARRLWPLDEKYPTILIIGGSSGAAALNQWVWSHLDGLTKIANIIHLAGVGKMADNVPSTLKDEGNLSFVPSPFKGEGRACPVPRIKCGAGFDTGVRVGEANYHQLEFLGRDLAHALAAADIVVSRAGIATLTELSYLGKPAVLIPIADTHQEENADYFRARAAAVVFRQNELDERVVEKIKLLLAAADELAALSESIKKIMKFGARERMVEIIEETNHESN